MVTEAFKSAFLILSPVMDKGFIDADDVTDTDLARCSCIHAQLRGGKALYKLSGEPIDGEGLELANRETLRVEGTENIENFCTRAVDGDPILYFELCE